MSGANQKPVWRSKRKHGFESIGGLVFYFEWLKLTGSRGEYAIISYGGL